MRTAASRAKGHFARGVLGTDFNPFQRCQALCRRAHTRSGKVSVGEPDPSRSQDMEADAPALSSPASSIWTDGSVSSVLTAGEKETKCGLSRERSGLTSSIWYPKREASERNRELVREPVRLHLLANAAKVRGRK